MAVHIKPRKTSDGKTKYLVYYRRGGRDHKNLYAGSFTTKKLAELRRDVVAGELAAGRDPRILLNRIVAPQKRVGLAERCNAFIRSRIDVAPNTEALYGHATAKWLSILGDVEPHAISVEMVQDGIVEEMADLSPNTVRVYTSTLRQVLEFCDVSPNPCVSPKLRLPAADRGEVVIPSSPEWHGIVSRVRSRSLLALELIECLGLRVSECSELEYGDFDFVRGELRVARSRTKTRSGRRWLAVPDELLARVAETCAPEGRLQRRAVFHGLSNDMIRHDVRQACVLAGVPEFSPHDLRHRRISLWVRLGVDGVTVKTWAGHAKASVMWDTYAHLVVDPGGDRWGSFWRGVYAGARERDAAEVEA